MNSTTIYIESFSALHADGFFSPAGRQNWENDQMGPRDIRRPQVLSSIFPLFGKLNVPDKLAFSTAALALSGVSDPGGEQTGISIGIPYGSLSTDLKYAESVKGGFPSPAYFSATLPSSPISDIAIYYGIKGPNRIYAGGDCPGLSALNTASILLSGGKATRMLSLSVWESELTENNYLKKKPSTPDCAAALFCTSAADEKTIAEMELYLGSGNKQSIKNSFIEQEIFMEIVNALIKKETVRISVSQNGFEGYISLRYR